MKERCLDFIEENTESVFRTKGFHELSEEALALLLQSDKLMMDELEILAAVREWATVNSVSLRAHLYCYRLREYTRNIFTEKALLYCKDAFTIVQKKGTSLHFVCATSRLL